MTKILRQVSLDRANRKKDGSVSITFVTDLEQSSEEFMQIDDLRNSRGILYYKAHGELTQAEVDELDNVDIELEGKTKSQRLRAVMFLNWKQSGDKRDFKEYYAGTMEQIIEHYKRKLDELDR